MKLLISCLISLVPFLLKSQSDLSIKNSSYIDLNYKNFNFEISIGELITNTIENNEITVNQGFLQPNYDFDIKIIDKENLNLSIFPNPFNQLLNIETNQEISSIEVIDISGKSVFFSIYQNQINLENLNSGFYFLNLYNHNQFLISSFKIIKL